MILRHYSWMIAVVLAALTWPGHQATADEVWQPFNPFNEVERRKAEKLKRDAVGTSAKTQEPALLRPMNSPDAVADPAAASTATTIRDAVPAPVEKGQLAPGMA